MISEWSIENFKSAEGFNKLPFAPLTIFSGANSSGKSTVIQSILLTIQTVQSPVLNRGVILNGALARLGTFSDLLSNGAKQPMIRIGFQLSRLSDYHSAQFRYRRQFAGDVPEDAEEDASIRCTFTFSPEASTENKEVAQLQPEIEESRVEFVSGSMDKRGTKIKLTRNPRTATDDIAANRLDERLLQPNDIAALNYNVEMEGDIESRRQHYFHSETKTRNVGAYRRHFLPGRLAATFDVVEDSINQLIDSPYEPSYARPSRSSVDIVSTPGLYEIILDVAKLSIAGNEQTLNPRIKREFVALQKDFSPATLTRLRRALPISERRMFDDLIGQRRKDIEALVRAERPLQFRLAPKTLPDQIEFSVDVIQTSFTECMKYLGPLRDEPKPVYPLAGATDPKDVGLRGEHTAAVLDVHRNTEIDYIPSPPRYGDLTTTKPSRVTLQKAVLDWLSYMGVGEDLVTRDHGKLGHGITVKTSADYPPHDLTHVGVGVSQVLPILVLSLIADRGTTLIFEQPELHLHPRVQTRLADFFVSLTLLKKQCIIETHSEYFVNRLRLLSAAEESAVVSDNVKIYFVDKVKGRSSYRPVTINEYGVIKDWPRGFFDESEQNAAAVIEAARLKRAKNKGNA